MSLLILTLPLLVSVGSVLNGEILPADQQQAFRGYNGLWPGRVINVNIDNVGYKRNIRESLAYLTTITDKCLKFKEKSISDNIDHVYVRFDANSTYPCEAHRGYCGSSCFGATHMNINPSCSSNKRRLRNLFLRAAGLNKSVEDTGISQRDIELIREMYNCSGGSNSCPHTDDYDSCSDWAESGFCTGEHQDFMQEHCKKSCKCSGPMTTPAPNANEGVIMSPNYPDHYPNDLDEEYPIYVDHGYRIRMDFTNIYLEKSDGCVFDWVQVVDGSNGEILMDKTCGIRSTYVYSKNTKIVVKFHSDGSDSDFGFRAEWKAEALN